MKQRLAVWSGLSAKTLNRQFLSGGGCRQQAQCRAERIHADPVQKIWRAEQGRSGEFVCKGMEGIKTMVLQIAGQPSTAAQQRNDCRCPDDPTGKMQYGQQAGQSRDQENDIRDTV